VTCEVGTPDVERESLPILFSLFFVFWDGGACIINKLRLLPFSSFHYSYASLRILSHARFGHPFYSLLIPRESELNTTSSSFFFISMGIVSACVHIN